MPAQGELQRSRRKCVQTLRKCARAAHVARCSDSAGRERVAAMVELIRGVGGPELQRAEEAFAEYEATFPQESADASGDDARTRAQGGGRRE